MENPLDVIIAKDPRYKPEAYAFVHDALGHTCSKLEQRRHVTGRELLDGIKDLALTYYGPMAKAVLNSWGVRTTDDFGAIVFNLVDAGLLSKTEQDHVEDFHDVYDFDEAFVRSYDLPGPETQRPS
ncbi:MAG TPA: Minf_1886 family protein [bacterium]|nr:Minf_1886 family protein [bacterium]